MEKSTLNILRITLFLLAWLQLAGTKASATIPTEEVSQKIASQTDSLSPATEQKGLLRKVVNYFRNSDKISPDKKFDFGFLPGPHYSSTAGLGLGMVATGTYSTDRSDSLLPRSNISLYGDMTTKGFLLIGLKGNNVFPKDKYRLDYRLYVYTFPTEFWGIGYENGDNDNNETDYRRMRFDIMARFMARIAPNAYLGPIVNFKYIQARDIKPEGIHLWAGENQTVHSQTVGLSFTYDSRDFMLNAYWGWFVQLDQTFTPRFLGNDYCFSTTGLTASTYRPIWKGGILAGEFHTQFNYGHPAWSMLAEVGSNQRMRGYFEGRYRDKNIIEAQIELRQKIYRRHGFALWAGAAEIFPRFEELRLKKILPNAGIGYRWEFKKRINVRADYGLTRNGGGFLFSINEAF